MLSKKQRKGFTLVELLIVIIIIGILAGVMLPVISKARAKARATRIVSDMIAIKKAAQMRFADTLSWFVIDNVGNNGNIHGYGFFSASILDGYLDQDIIDAAVLSDQDDYTNCKENRYFLYANEPNGGDYAASNGRYNVFVIANVMDDYVDQATRLALQKMAPDIGLFNGDYTDNLDKEPANYYFTAKDTPTHIINNGGGGIVMRIN